MRFFHNDVLDALGNYIKSNCDKMVMTEGASTVYADCTTNNGTGTGVKVSEKTVTGTDFTLGDGTPDGRETVVSSFDAVAVAADGEADHVAFLDTGASKVLAVIPMSAALSLTTSDTVNWPAQEIVERDPTAPA